MAARVTRRLQALGLDVRGRQTIARWTGSWWRWHDGHHRAIEDEAARAELWTTLRRIDVETIDDEGKVSRKPLAVTSRGVSEAADAMMAVCDRIEATAELPFALPGYDGPAARSVAIVRNGLLELATGTLHAPSPRLFATAGAAVDYDPTATCPEWLRFLEQIFSDEDGIDHETVRLARQVFGWLVAGDTTRHAIPLVIGPTRSGKSTMMTVLRELLSAGNVCAPPLASLAESRFGLAPLLGKTAAIIPDARLGSRADQAAVAGLLLAASGHDTVSIDRKGRDAVEARLRCRIVVVTNELPRISDASDALAGRFLVVETRNSFLGREDLGLEERLRAELPGVLRWALEGWHDLVADGWVRPRRAQEALDELDRLGSPIKAFVADRLVVAPGAESAIDVLYREWCSWCDDAGRKEHGTTQTFARDLRAAVPGVKVRQPRTDAGRIRMYAGLGVRTGRTS